MKQTVLRLGLSGFLAASILLVGNVPPTESVALATETKKTASAKEAKKVKGKITNISQKAKTIALSKKDKSFFLVKFTDQTELKNVKSAKDFKVGEAILVKYKTVGGENIATSLQKAIVKLPEGVKEIKTEPLDQLLSQRKDIVVVDARPPVKFAENHIAGAVSIPYAKLVKMGDKSSALFEKYKNKQLIFYCGGPT